MIAAAIPGKAVANAAVAQPAATMPRPVIAAVVLPRAAPASCRRRPRDCEKTPAARAPAASSPGKATPSMPVGPVACPGRVVKASVTLPNTPRAQRHDHAAEPARGNRRGQHRRPELPGSAGRQRLACAREHYQRRGGQGQVHHVGQDLRCRPPLGQGTGHERAGTEPCRQRQSRTARTRTGGAFFGEFLHPGRAGGENRSGDNAGEQPARVEPGDPPLPRDQHGGCQQRQRGKGRLFLPD